MPNINLLQTITTASNTDGYFVMSNSGLARRFRYNDLVSQLQQSGLGRTNQDLYNTSEVTFKSVTIQDSASSIGDLETKHGFQTNYRNANGGAIRAGDFVGSLRFGGYDGNNNTLLDNAVSVAGVTSISLENWDFEGNQTIAAGTGISLYHQPVNTQLTTSTRVTVFSALSTVTSTLSQAVSVIRIGSSTINPLVVTTSSNGLATFIGNGRADLFFTTSRLHQTGVTSHDTSPINSTVTGTNSFMFVTSRYSNAPGLRQPLKNGDDIGVFIARAATSPNAVNFGEEVAGMGFDATSDYTPSVHGSLFYVRTCSTATDATPVRTFISSPEVSRYSSDVHTFTDSSLGNPLVISSGTVVFGDSTVQNTAYPGFTSVPPSSNSPGTPGQMAHDNTYFYICVATNQWKRILAADF